MLQDKTLQEEYLEKGKLGRHETFTPRYGWLKKGYEGVSNSLEQDIFKTPNAIELLGVGKNMVASIKFWGQAFKLIRTAAEGGMETTEMGDKLLADTGWDPYLEDVASLWLLHWQLFIPPLEAVNWVFAFNKCNLWSFDIQQLSSVLENAANGYHKLKSLSSKSFEKDASCIIRMYTENTRYQENEIECPFQQLGLIRIAEEKNKVYFNTAEKQSLPDLIFAAACFSYIQHYASANQKTISLERLTYDFNSPGIIYKLTESAVGKHLHAAAKQLPSIELVDSLGSVQLHFSGDPVDLFWETLRTYYDGG